MRLIVIATLLTISAALFFRSQTTHPGLGDSVVYSSRYLTMRDGVKIAVDLYLPKELKEGTRLPTILHQTRYYRSYEIRPPFSLFWGGIREPIIRRFVNNGYAYVFVDTRGSGASFGSRTQEWSPDEIRDGAEVVNWILRQPWSNGKVGATGGSYEGVAAEFLLVNHHPAVKAIVPRFSMFDMYTDMAFVGGVQFAFVEMWGRATTALDRNQFGEAFLNGMAKLAFKGVRPVQEDQDRSLLAAAIREHADNYDLVASIRGKSFKDDSNHVEAMSPYAHLKEIEASGTAIYSYDGWYDAAMPHAAIKRFLSVRTPDSRLILGPWNHQGKNLSPYATSKEQFDHVGEMLRFFDYHLKGIDNGIKDEKPVRYYTIGEEKWKSADSWPPPGAQPVVYYFSAEKSLTEHKPTAEEGRDTYRVDYTAGTGRDTRWNSLFPPVDESNISYPDRAEQDKKLLSYTSAPLDQDVEVTGHPIITLFVNSSATDGNFFVYLEDLDEQGRVQYVTEGMLRAIHRKVSDQPSPYKLVVPYRTFKRADAVPLLPDQVAELTFDLFPISYLFKKGHSIRLALAGADKDHFIIPAGEPPTVQFYRARMHSSRIMLPVIPR